MVRQRRHVRKVTQLRRLADDPSGKADEPCGCLVAPHGGGGACGACANLAGYRVAAPTNALRMALTARCSAT